MRRDPNQSSAPPVIDYNGLALGDAKETYPLKGSRAEPITNNTKTSKQVLGRGTGLGLGRSM